jgi:hypothetical protein
MTFKLAIATTALTLLVCVPCARANLIGVESGSASFEVPGAGQTQTSLEVNYDVVFDCQTRLFTYLYQFTPLADSPVGTFQINASYINSVLPTPTLTLIEGAPYTVTGVITATGTIGKGAVSWSWNPATTVEQLVGYNSFFGPVDGMGSLTAGGFGLSADPPLSGVPEAPTILAGALLLLPLGLGAVRSLRRDRSSS